MNQIDIVITIALLFFFFSGIALGFISAVGSLMGVIAGGLLASQYYLGFSHWLAFIGAGWAKLVAFLFIFFLVNRLVGLVFYFINKIFKIISIIPFLKTFNRLLGGILGLLEGIFFVGVGLYIASRVDLGFDIRLMLNHSTLAPILVKIAGLLIFIIPDKIRHLPGVI